MLCLRLLCAYKWCLGVHGVHVGGGTKGRIPSKACLTNVLIQDLQYVRGGTMHVLQDTLLWLSSPAFK